MPACSPDPDFPALFRAAYRSYVNCARFLIRECDRAGVPHNAQFWFDAALDAERAALLVESLLQNGQSRQFIAIALERLRLVPFAETFATGDTTLLRIDNKPIPGEVTLSDVLVAGPRESATSWTAAERKQLQQAGSLPELGEGAADRRRANSIAVRRAKQQAAA